LPSKARIQSNFDHLVGMPDVDAARRTALDTARTRLLAQRQHWDKLFVSLERDMGTRSGEAAKQVADAVDAMAHARYKLEGGSLPSQEWLNSAKTRLAGETANREALNRAFQRLEDALQGRLGMTVSEADLLARARALRAARPADVEEALALLKRTLANQGVMENPAVIAETLGLPRWMVTDASIAPGLTGLRPGPLAERTGLLFREVSPSNAAEARKILNWGNKPLEPKAPLETHARDLSERLLTLSRNAEGVERTALERAAKHVDDSRKLLLPE